MGMSTAMDVVTVALLGSLSLVTVLRWRSHRHPTQAWLTASVGLLGAFVLLNSLYEVAGIPFAAHGGVLAVLASAFALVQARHTIRSVPRLHRLGAGGALLLLGVVLIASGATTGEPSVNMAQEVALLSGLIVWGACVIDPILCFVRSGRRRHLLQRSRMRGISAGYGSILGIFCVLVLVGDSPREQVVVEGFRLAFLVSLFVSFAPPQFVRRLWRAREERSLIQSSPLFTAATAADVLSAGTEWALRLVGADRAFITTSDGRTLASASEPGAGPADGNARLSVPLGREKGGRLLSVCAGPFTPPFGPEEERLLDYWADAIDAALDRLGLDEARSAFLTAVSHELRTPLTALSGIAQTLQRPESRRLDPDQRRRLARALLRNERRLEALVDNLLDAERLSRGAAEPRLRAVAPARLVDAVLADSDLLHGRAVSVEHDPTTVSIDPRMTTRILQILLANAAKHTPPGTPVDVRTARLGGGLEIAVEDRGPGIPAEMRSEVFRLFRQVPGGPSHDPGTGIGLALVAGLAAAQGGRAWVEERDGGGASFRVWIPGTVAAEPWSCSGEKAAAAEAIITPGVSA